MGQNRKRIIIIACMYFAVALTVAAGSVVLAQEEQQQFEGFNLQGYDDQGAKTWDVNGDTADILGNTIKISNVVANAYGDEDMNVTAETGVIDKASGHIHLEKDVVITAETGANLKTEVLDWYRNDDLVTTEEFVTITDKQIVATGTGITAHPDLQLAQLNKDVTVNVDTEDKSGEKQHITITSDGPMEIDQSKNLAIFNDNVVAVQIGRVLKADKVELFFNPKTKKIDEMICIGNVHVTHGENESFSDRAVYHASNQKLILTGRPKLILITEGEGSIGEMDKKDDTSKEDTN